MIMAWHYVMIWSALEICIGNLHCFCEGKHPLFAIKVEVMFITLLHYDPHLHKMKAEPSQTLTSEMKHRNDTSCRYILLLIYPLLLMCNKSWANQYVQTYANKTWANEYVHQHMQQIMSKQTCSNICKQIMSKQICSNICKQNMSKQICS